MNNLNGARLRSNYTWKAVQDAWVNAMETRPPLVSSQLKYISRDMQRLMEVPTVNIRSQNDPLLDGDRVATYLKIQIWRKINYSDRAK